MGIQIKDLVTSHVTEADIAYAVAWDNISNRPILADVATSGSYNDLTDKPSHLSTTGGTITGKLSISATTWNGQLALTRTNNGSNWGPCISFYDEKGGRGALMMENNKLFVSDVSGTTSLRKEVSLVGHTHAKSEISDFDHTHNYLPLTGGTLAATSSNTPLTIKGTASGNDSWIAYHNNNGFLASVGVDSSKNFRFYNGTSYKVWHEGNDGPNSGLDADTLDGYDPAGIAALSSTAGTTEKASTKLFLAGATSQGTAQTTYSNSKCYIGTNNCLYSNGKQVSTTDHSHSYLSSTLNNIEFNTNGSLPQYGGFIDFHYHKKDTSDGDKVKPTDNKGNFVASTPDYTSRIIEDAPGQISVNSTRFTIDTNNKTNVTASYFHGLADNAVEADKLDGKHAADFALAGHTHDDRLFVTLVPTGTAIPANADLKTTAYLKVGRYYCSATATAVTLKNCPVDQAFMMEVYSPLSTTLDNETTAKWVYRLRKITHYYTGVQYWQYVGSGSNPGEFSYGAWYALPQVAVTLDTTDTNGSTLAKGSNTKPVYIDAAGRFIECDSYPTIPGSLPANGGNADTVDNKHASDFALVGHTTPTFTGATSSADGTGGHVPAPVAGQRYHLLSGGSDWATLGVRNSSTPYKMYLTFTDSAGNRSDISNCTLNAPLVDTSKNGLCPILPNDTNLFLRGDGQWAAPPKQTVDGGTTTDNDTKNTAGATNSTSKLFLVGAPTQTASSVTYSNSLCYATDGYLYSNDTKVSVEGHNHNSSYLGWNRGAFNVNSLYDGGIYMIASGSNLPFGSQYAQVLNLPYRKLTGNTKPDFGAQIALPTGDDASKPNTMFFRTSLSDTWNAWQEVSVVGHKHTKNEITDFAHTHTYSGGTAASNGAHSHSLGGDMGSAGGHTHTLSGTPASNGAHEHTVTATGSNSQAGAHEHTVTATGSVTLTGTLDGTCLILGATFTGTSATTSNTGGHTHEFTGTSATTSNTGGHTHEFTGTSATTSNTGGHTHELSGVTATSAGAHKHELSGVTATSAGSHTHTVSGTTASA